MWNPFKPRIVVTIDQVINALVEKEAALQIARAQVQNAVQIIEQLKARIAALETPKPTPTKETA